MDDLQFSVHFEEDIASKSIQPNALNPLSTQAITNEKFLKFMQKSNLSSRKIIFVFLLQSGRFTLDKSNSIGLLFGDFTRSKSSEYKLFLGT
jgi:hypothetical protein